MDIFKEPVEKLFYDHKTVGMRRVQSKDLNRLRMYP